MRYLKFFPTVAITLLLFVLILPFIGSRINRPFIGHHDFNGAFYSQIARNYLKIGLIKSRGAQIINSGDISNGDWNLHTHHPATYPILLSLIFSNYWRFGNGGAIIFVSLRDLRNVTLNETSQNELSGPPSHFYPAFSLLQFDPGLRANSVSVYRLNFASISTKENETVIFSRVYC